MDSIYRSSKHLKTPLILTSTKIDVQNSQQKQISESTQKPESDSIQAILQQIMKKFQKQLDYAISSNVKNLMAQLDLMAAANSQHLKSAIKQFVKLQSAKQLQSKVNNPEKRNYSKISRNKGKQLESLSEQKVVDPVSESNSDTLKSALNDQSEFCQESTNKKIEKRCWRQWTKEQNMIYLECLNSYEEQFEPGARRKTRIFQKMSKMLGGSKTGDQCRGHHKKLIENYSSIENVRQIVKYRIDSTGKKYPLELQSREIYIQPPTHNAKELQHRQIYEQMQSENISQIFEEGNKFNYINMF